MSEGAWMSKNIGRTAHYVEAGVPLCAAVVDRFGAPVLSAFTRRFVPLRQGERRCYLCRRVLSRRAQPAVEP